MYKKGFNETIFADFLEHLYEVNKHVKIALLMDNASTHKHAPHPFPHITSADRTTGIGKMIDSYLKGDSELDDHAIHLLFAANRRGLINYFFILILFFMQIKRSSYKMARHKKCTLELRKRGLPSRS